MNLNSHRKRETAQKAHEADTDLHHELKRARKSQNGERIPSCMLWVFGSFCTSGLK
jgi:hypothetical protein